jgi:DNA-binding transcriptional regulator YhcF (GntR family)
LAWDFEPDRPIYVQIVERLSVEIAAGRLNPGDKMLSVRELAAEAGVNPNTVQRALTELERGGMVVSMRGGAGRFVSNDSSVRDATKQKLMKDKALVFIENVRSLGLDNDEIISLVKECLNKEA